MTNHYFSNDLVVMHYYRFGNGPKNMFCFHGYGMHGRQFKLLEETMGDEYTFYGFDLFFHKKTLLRDQSISAVRKGISKKETADLFIDICKDIGIEKFSIVAYSMGSHYATTLIEEMPEFIDELFIAAPSSLKPGKIIAFLSANRMGNKVLERMALSDNGMTRLLSVLRRLKVIDQNGHDILYREVASPDLRFSFYACASYMRFLTLNAKKFVTNLNKHEIKSVFIFGERDKNYPPSIGRTIIPRINLAKQFVVDENHDMINPNFANVLSALIHDH